MAQLLYLGKSLLIRTLISFTWQLLFSRLFYNLTKVYSKCRETLACAGFKKKCRRPRGGLKKPCLFHNTVSKGASQPLSSRMNSADQFWSSRHILWPELKVTTALDSISAIVKHEVEESGGKRDTVQWRCGFRRQLTSIILPCVSL